MRSRAQVLHRDADGLPVYTTGQAARILGMRNVSVVSGFCERGTIKAFRGAGNHFRIWHADLVYFAELRGNARALRMLERLGVPRAAGASLRGPWSTAEEVATMLGASANHVQRLCRDGLVACRRCQTAFLIPESETARLLEEAAVR